MTRILVVDDNQDLAASMRAILETAGYAAACVTDGEHALQRQRAEDFDLVVTDIFMPGQEGLATIRQLHLEFPALKIIAMSGGGDLGIGLDSLRVATHLGAGKTLRKPFRTDELLAAIRELLQTG